MANEITQYGVLIVEDIETRDSQIANAAIEHLAEELQKRHFELRRAYTYDEAHPVVTTDMDLDVILLSSDMELDRKSEVAAEKLLRIIAVHQAQVPVFLLADRARTAAHFSEKMMSLVDEFVWIYEDSPVFIAGRIEAAAARFRQNLLPPMMRAMWEYNERNHEYSWAAPGHQGGVGFTKSPVGKKFSDFYGENLFRTDTGIERTSIGSLLDHSGAFHAGEVNTAKVFGAHASYSVVVGTSGSNRTVMQSMLTAKDVALCDRNAHKSIEQGLILTGATPIYMVPSRNCYGIIGPVLRREMTPEAVKTKLQKSDLKCPSDRPAYAVVTNCTYDGLCYNAAKVEHELAKTVDVVHFDEAWYAYARFNPMYEDHFAMRGDPADHKGPTVFATHSTHKLLTALSQASYIHVREGRRPVEFNRFNQSYMLHATTSPLYAICASNDIATAMMQHSGQALTSEVIAEAVDFRQALAKLHREFAKKGSWFFQVWNAEKITDYEANKVYDFADAPRELLIRDQRCWRLEPGAPWHGFADLEDNWVMLDPIKVSILAPGMKQDGTLASHGVPAAVVSAYLYLHGIVPTRTTDFQLMFLFAMGITKGKWGTLLNTLLRFKSLYDRNAPLSESLPYLVKDHADYYGKLGTRELCDRMFEFISKEQPEGKLDAAFKSLPAIKCTPREAFEKIVENQVELVPADRLANRIAANSVIPYPPGIPMLMSGESFGAKDSPQIEYLQLLARWDAQFPGFEHETEGSAVKDGVYHVLCLPK